MDNEVLPGMDKSPEEIAQEIRFAAVVKWYEFGMMNRGKAAQMLGYNPGEIWCLMIFDGSFWPLNTFRKRI